MPTRRPRKEWSGPVTGRFAASGQVHDIEAVVDTGYSGFLTLPTVLVAGLGLPFAYIGQAFPAEDYEYGREGARNLFLDCEPPAGWRHVAVTERPTIEDFAHQMRWLVDEAYPDVPVVRLVLGNLNTHRKASLYQTFPAADARRIAKRLEYRYTPKHGSWLNMAEIEFSLFSGSVSRRGVPL